MLHKGENQALDPQNLQQHQGGMMIACNPGAWEAQTGDPWGSWLARLAIIGESWVQGETASVNKVESNGGHAALTSGFCMHVHMRPHAHYTHIKKSPKPNQTKTAATTAPCPTVSERFKEVQDFVLGCIHGCLDCGWVRLHGLLPFLISCSLFLRQQPQ